MRHSLVAWAFVLPALLLISVSVLLPALMALVMSFSSTGLDVSEPLQFVGLDGSLSIYGHLRCSTQYGYTIGYHLTAMARPQKRFGLE